jgi:hypothetical protein
MFGQNLLLYYVGAKFGSEVIKYEHNISFFTILYGAGDIVQQFRPHASLHFITKFIHGLSSPPL